MYILWCSDYGTVYFRLYFLTREVILIEVSQLKFLLIILFVGVHQLCFAATPNIFILKTRGSCPDCSEKIAKMLESGGLSSKIIGPSDLKKDVSVKDTIVVPGGDSEWDIKQDLLKAKSFNWLKKFIYNGGKYIGFCAGAYLTEKWIVKGDKGLDIFPGIIKNYSENKSSRAIETKWQKVNSRFMFFQDGPAFFPKKNSGVEVLARFSEIDIAAAVLFSYGKGKVGLISPHPEADTDWYAEDKVNDKDGVDYDLGLYFVNRVLNN